MSIHNELHTSKADEQFYEEDDTRSFDNDYVGVFPAWSRFTGRIERLINCGMLALSVYAAKHPYMTIVCFPILSFVLVGAGYVTNFRLITDQYVTFAPFHSTPERHRKWIQDDKTGFNDMRSPFFLTIHADGSNVMGKEGIRTVFAAIDAVRNTPGYENNCAQSSYVEGWSGQTTCEIYAVTRFWEHKEARFDNFVNSDEDVVRTLSSLTFPDGTPLDLGVLVGSSELMVNGMIESTRAFFVYIMLVRADGIHELEKDALERVFQLQKEWEATTTDGSLLKIEVTADRSFADEFERAIFKDLPLAPIGFFIMSAFTCLIFARNHPVESRTLLGVGAVLTIVMSILSGFGFMFLIGVPYTNMTTILPFILFGIGLDDTFIITSHYFRTDHREDPVQRLESTISTVGTSIFVTTFTTSLAFFFGLISNIPAIHWLCLYAFPMVIIDFIYQITFFVALLILDERRIQSNRRDICVCFTISSTSSSVSEASYNNNNNGTMDADSEEEEVEDENECSVPEGSDDDNNIKKIKSRSKTSVPDRFMAWYATQLMRPCVKFVVLVSFAAFLVYCCFCTTKMTQEFIPTDLVPNDSYVKRYIDAYTKYNARVLPIEIFFRNVDQSDPNIQQQMVKYIDDLVSLDYFGREPQFCWVLDFPQYLNLLQVDNNINDNVSLTFNEQIEALLSLPVMNELYGQRIIRDEDGNILSSRCEMNIYNLDPNSVRDQIDFLDAQQRITDQQPINVGRKDEAFFTYSDLYLLFEFFSVHIHELKATTISGLIAVAIVGFIFVPHFSAVFFIVPLMLVLYIDLIGTLQISGLHMNVVTFVSLVISIGLLVDFVMHILLRYYESSATTREGKVRDALQTIGPSILVGGLSTFLGVVVLAASTSVVLQNIYVCFLAMVLLGCSHGLILLPVLLSLLGPRRTIYNSHNPKQKTNIQTH